MFVHKLRHIYTSCQILNQAAYMSLTSFSYSYLFLENLMGSSRTLLLSLSGD